MIIQRRKARSAGTTCDVKAAALTSQLLGLPILATIAVAKVPKKNRTRGTLQVRI